MLANLVLRWEEHGTVGGRVEVLDRAGLVTSRRMGREVRYSARPERLGETARWMSSLAEEWDARLAALKRLAEGAEGR